jgi:hypothetical protein
MCISMHLFKIRIGSLDMRRSTLVFSIYAIITMQNVEENFIPYDKHL